MDFYVYEHSRADSGIPFYIGKGKGNRATEFRRRNQHWNNIRNKHGVTVKILYSGLTEEEAFAKEIELITEYKTKYGDQLANQSAGGDGNTRPEQLARHKEEILEFILKNKRLPCHHKEEEKFIYSRYKHYTKETDFLFDPLFRDKVKETRALGLRSTNLEKSKEDIRLQVAKTGRLPSQRGTPEEKKLYKTIGYLCNPSSKGFDPEFLKEVEQYGYGSQVEKTKNQIRHFYQANGRLPYPSEALYDKLRNYCCPSSFCYDESFRQEMITLGYCQK